jgi:hypothetical protein
MSAKYYMQFVLDEGGDDESAEYGGVVELDAVPGSLEAGQLEALLAENLDVEAGNVRLIHCARLQ